MKQYESRQKWRDFFLGVTQKGRAIRFNPRDCFVPRNDVGFPLLSLTQNQL